RDRRQRVPADLFRQPDRAAAKVRDRARAAVQSVALANFGKLVVYPRAVMLSAHEVAKVVSEVTGRIIERVGARSRQPGGRSLAEVINETLWWEQERLSKADASDEEAQADKQFYSHIRRQLPRVSEAEQARLLERVVHRHADEIAGNFDPTVYKLATRLGPPMLSALLTGLSPRRLLGGQSIPRLDQHVIIEGEVATLARLRERGTLIVTPTHSSNLDSLLIGF